MRALAALVAVLSLLAGPGAPTSSAAARMNGATLSAASSARALDLKALKPPVVWKPIPFGDRRKRQMGGYSLRHYGERTWKLTDPKVIVEHYTAGTSFTGAWNTFASNTKHNGEYPGTCAHYIIDTDGTIYQLVPLTTRCRHAVGMNWTSVGIEHVGTSDRMVLDNRPQMRASLRLTTYLMARFGINVGNVIGHNETLQSPYHQELYASWRCLVHADFPHWAMKRYRTRLRNVATAKGVPAGKGPVWVDPGC
jgi:N-acetylmuramoyl-L-alanine amidase